MNATVGEFDKERISDERHRRMNERDDVSGDAWETGGGGGSEGIKCLLIKNVKNVSVFLPLESTRVGGQEQKEKKATLPHLTWHYL